MQKKKDSTSGDWVERPEKQRIWSCSWPLPASPNRTNAIPLPHMPLSASGMVLHGQGATGGGEGARGGGDKIGKGGLIGSGSGVSGGYEGLRGGSREGGCGTEGTGGLGGRGKGGKGGDCGTSGLGEGGLNTYCICTSKSSPLLPLAISLGMKIWNRRSPRPPSGRLTLLSMLPPVSLPLPLLLKLKGRAALSLGVPVTEMLTPRGA
mmetsp:Transcript_7886/g.21043  ORF Transcript_7886/g.21043 Transcript_7886/m.21043 type:complete len:207 (+) Transcript_7886:542-1162(+)